MLVGKLGSMAESFITEARSVCNLDFFLNHYNFVNIIIHKHLHLVMCFDTQTRRHNCKV